MAAILCVKNDDFVNMKWFNLHVHNLINSS